MNTSDHPILVVGAAGRHGGTGGTVVREFLAKKVPVRALVRHRDERAEALETLGVEVVLGDLNHRGSLLEALEDVETAYFAYPVSSGIVDAAANFSSAARARGLKRLVIMSMGVSRPDSPSHLGRAQWLAEELFEVSGFSCIHLRIAAFFFENLPLLHGSDIRGDGVLRNSFDGTRLHWMAGRDAAKLAVAALLQPERFAGRTAVYPTGNQLFSHAELSAIASQHVGRQLRHETISQCDWETRLAAQSQHDGRLNADMIRHIGALSAVMKQSYPSNDLIKETLEEEQESFEAAIKRGLLDSPVFSPF